MHNLINSAHEQVCNVPEQARCLHTDTVYCHTVTVVHQPREKKEGEAQQVAVTIM